MGITKKDLDRHCDLDTREEVEELMKRFYSDVAQDEILGHIFNDVARVDWSEHIPKLTDFWCRLLFNTRDYTGNALEQHRKINAVEPFTPEHFRRWLELFQETVDLGWTGERAEFVKKKAVDIAVVHSNQIIGTPIDLTLNPRKSRKPTKN